MKTLDDLIEKHGLLGVLFEQNLFSMARNYSKDYDSGYWKPVTLTDDDGREMEGFYLTLDEDKEFEIRNCPNIYNLDNMDSKTYSYTIFSFVCNIVGNHFYEKGMEEFAADLFELYHFTRENAEKVLSEIGLKQYFTFID